MNLRTLGEAHTPVSISSSKASGSQNFPWELLWTLQLRPKIKTCFSLPLSRPRPPAPPSPADSSPEPGRQGASGNYCFRLRCNVGGTVEGGGGHAELAEDNVARRSRRQDRAELRRICKMVLHSPEAVVYVGCTPSVFTPGMTAFRSLAGTRCHLSSRPHMTMTLQLMASPHRGVTRRKVLHIPPWWARCVLQGFCSAASLRLLDNIFTWNPLPRVPEQMTGKTRAEQRWQMGGI